MGSRAPNYYGWRHGDNDRLLDQMAQEMTETRRIELQRRQQELWVEELPSLPLWSRSEPGGITGGLTWNVHEWAWRP